MILIPKQVEKSASNRKPQQQPSTPNILQMLYYIYACQKITKEAASETTSEQSR